MLYGHGWRGKVSKDEGGRVRDDGGGKARKNEKEEGTPRGESKDGGSRTVSRLHLYRQQK